uniref:Serine hydrolase domain-containing protein n=1 Tax=Araucaria cunninghamii TaxID=56994 RepID=A0A0D6QRF4_ARACU
MGEGKDLAGGRKKLRVLCLHGFRTSGSIMQKQIGKWDKSVLERLDLCFPDAPFPAEGKSDVEGHFPPPYYEWFQFNPLFTEYRNMDKCQSYIEDYMIEHGPFDGLLGFSQGAILSAGLAGLQSKGLALTRVPPIQFVIIVSGAKFKALHIQQVAYSTPIKCPSLHFVGDNDFLKCFGEQLLESFVDPVVIRHPKGHTVPRLDDEGVNIMTSFLDRVEEYVHMNVGYTIKPENLAEQSEKLQLEEEVSNGSSF